MVALTATALAAVGAAYALLAPPIFRADMLVQVEDRSEPKGAGGLQELTDMFSVKSPAETEMEILRSRSLLASVIDQLRLDVVVTPVWFPIVGGAWSRRHDADALQPPVAGLDGYAWGGERLAIAMLQVPRRYEGERLLVTALAGGRYELRDPDGTLLLTSRAGETAVSGSSDVRLVVSDLRARSGTSFRVTKLAREKALDELQRDLVIAEKGRKTGVIRVQLSGEDPTLVAAVLDAIGAAYVRQNVERKSAEAEKTLAFVNGQIPEQRQMLESAEAALKEYQSTHGIADVSLETQALIERSGEVERATADLQLERSGLTQRFTSRHHVMAALEEKARKLREQKAVIEERIRKVPQAELASVRLLRDVRVANELYVLLLNKAQELRVVRSGTIGNVRVLDRPLLPRDPVWPKPFTIVGTSLFVGLFLGGAAALLRKALSTSLYDPAEIEATAGVPVLASIAHTPRQEPPRSFHRRRASAGVLAELDPDDLAVEGVRSLRTSLQLAALDATTKVIAVTGPAPGVGKSFVAVNLAHVVGQAGKRVLVVDGDLRRGSVHRCYGVRERSPGLSDVLAGTVPFDAAVRRRPSDGVDLLATGTLPHHASELLLGSSLERLVEALRARYDTVVFDTPPCLAVTDASVICRLADVAVLVLRAGRHSAREIDEAVARLERFRVRVEGLVVNDVVHLPGRHRGYTYAYQYEYRPRRGRSVNPPGRGAAARSRAAAHDAEPSSRGEA